MPAGAIATVPILAGLHHQYVPDVIFGKDRLAGAM